MDDLVKILVGGGVLLCAIAGFSSCNRVEAATIRIIQDLPTVPGIRREPRPGDRYYDARQPRVIERPSADVLRLDAPAPASRCPGAFEVVSGPRSERGCYGGR